MWTCEPHAIIPMQLLAVDPRMPDSDVIGRAAEVLRAGGLVAFPTETVYGLGAHALDPRAVARIYAAKGRPSVNPLIVHVSDESQARALAAHWPSAAEHLAQALWPGPVTLVLPKRPEVPDAITAGLPSVALRVPAHPVALALIRAAGIPVAAPSANRYTELSPTTAQHVVKSLGDRVDMILDGGPTTVGIESTVVDLTGHAPVVLRPGTIPPERLRAILGQGGPLAAPELVAREEAPRASPGLSERHYAPRARLVVFDATAPEHAVAVARESAARGERVGALVRGATPAGVTHVERLPADPDGYARGLYAALHACDDAGCALVLVEAVPDDDAWTGVRDRLRRASR
jgi:L-threonylcarbamoyladenylate synthase